MLTDVLVHLDQFFVIHSGGLAFAVDSADVVLLHFVLHEVGEQRHALVGEQVATVFGGVADHAVHFVQLLTSDEVGDKRSLVERFVVGAHRLDAHGAHGFESEFHTGLDHGGHENATVEVFLFGDYLVGSFDLFEFEFARFATPLEEVLVAGFPVNHHGAGELAGDDVVLVFAVERLHDLLHLFGEFRCADLGRVGETVHHIGDTAVLQGFGNGFPAVLEQLDRVSRFNAEILHHLVVAKDGAGLEHTAKDGLFAHEVRLHFGDERAFENARTVGMEASSVSLGVVPTLTFGVVFRVHSDEAGHTETANVFATDFGTRALRGDHDHRDVLADFLAFFDDVEAVAVREGGALLHELHDGRDHVVVLLVRCEVANEVCIRNHFFVGTDLEAVFSSVLPGLALLFDGFLAERVRDVEAAIAQVKTLMETLGTATDEHDLLALEGFNTTAEFRMFHETAVANFFELATHRDRIEIIHFLNLC